MAEIVNLSDVREKIALRDGFALWRKRFPEQFDFRIRLLDLTPETLHRLAVPCEDSTYLINAMIIGFLGFGVNLAFESLEMRFQEKVVDIQLFVSDQVRFEMMYRLCWIERFIGNQYALFKMVRKFDKVYSDCMRQPPQLAKKHSCYEDYSRLFDRDKEVFIRRMLPAAMDAFASAFL
ncbi:MAG: hypothetical protein GY874_17025 [Desulfobacteraceae bacterium]|nr:hypothetical protein [Desulfobacteraceae bacterium]